MAQEMLDVMIDLETLGKRGNSVILSIGAVKFNGDGLGDEFYMVVDPQSCIAAGLEMDVSTIMWWMKQSDEARAAFEREGARLPSVLTAFSRFIQDGGNAGDTRVWGNGASFDNPILGNAYHKCGMEQPWKFWNDRCYRTVKSQFPDSPMPRTGTHHNALDDAKSQAQHLISFGLELS